MIHKFIAFILVLTFGYVQTIMVSHQGHPISVHAQDSSDLQIDSLLQKCGICDYHFTKRSEHAILASNIEIKIFSKTLDSFIDKKATTLPHSYINGLTNKGPPIV